MKKRIAIKLHRGLTRVYDGLMYFSENTFPKILDFTIGSLMDKIREDYADDIDEDWSIDLQIKNLNNG
jgi:hypothetical protein